MSGRVPQPPHRAAVADGLDTAPATPECSGATPLPPLPVLLGRRRSGPGHGLPSSDGGLELPPLDPCNSSQENSSRGSSPRAISSACSRLGADQCCWVSAFRDVRAAAALGVGNSGACLGFGRVPIAVRSTASVSVTSDGDNPPDAAEAIAVGVGSNGMRVSSDGRTDAPELGDCCVPYGTAVGVGSSRSSASGSPSSPVVLGFPSRSRPGPFCRPLWSRATGVGSNATAVLRLSPPSRPDEPGPPAPSDVVGVGSRPGDDEHPEAAVRCAHVGSA